MIEHSDEVVIKEGTRVIVDTPVSISSEPQNPITSDKTSSQNGAEKQTSEISNFDSEEDGSKSRGPVEIICDAFGKCKHGASTVIGKVKGKGVEAVGKTKESADESFDKTIETAHEFSKKPVEAVEKRAREALQKMKDTGKTAVDMSNTLSRDVKRNLTEEAKLIKDVNESAGYAFERVKTGAANVKEELAEIAPETWSQVINMMNILGFAAAYGMGVYVTFILSYVLSRALPRQQFGVVQSKFYPIYFRCMTFGIGMALLGHLFSHSNPDMLQGLNLLTSLLIVIVNMVYLEPKATKVCVNYLVMFEKNRDGEGRRQRNRLWRTDCRASRSS